MTDLRFTHRSTSGPPNSTAILCWCVDGNGTIPATGVVTNVSYPDSFPWKGPIAYPGNASSQMPVSIPDNFCTDVTLPSSGALYCFACMNGSDRVDTYAGAFEINVTK